MRQEKRLNEDLRKLMGLFPIYLEVMQKDPGGYEKKLKKVIGYFYESYGGFPPELMEPVKVIAVSQGKTDSITNMFRLLEKPHEKQVEMLRKVLDKHEKNRTSFLVGTGANVEYNDSRLLKYLKEITSSKIMLKTINYMDIGPSQGSFSNHLLQSVLKNGKTLKPLLVDAREVDVSKHPRLDKISEKIGFYDVITGKHPTKDVKKLLGKQHLIVCKQVMKFHRKKSEKAFKIFKDHMSHGSILVTGGPYRKYHEDEEKNQEVIVSPLNEMLDPFHDRTIAKIFVKISGKEPLLVKVNTREFLDAVRKMKSRKQYLRELPNIIKQTAATRPKRDKGKAVTYHKELKRYRM